MKKILKKNSEIFFFLNLGAKADPRVITEQVVTGLTCNDKDGLN